MRRRITVAIVATVAAALVLAGVGSLVLSGLQLRRSTASDLRADSATVVDSLVTEVAVGQGASAKVAQRLKAVAALSRRLRASDVGVVEVGATGVVKVLGNNGAGDLPGKVTAADLTSTKVLADLRAQTPVSGHHGRTTWAAASTKAGPRGAFFVVVLTRNAPLLPHGLLPWFLLAGGVALVAAIVVSMRLSDTLTRPLRAADAAARRIADGDLSTRLPEPPPTRTDELADLARAINTMAGSLDRARRVDQQFLLSVSHDLRTPLTSIRGWAEAIDEGATDDPRHAAGVIVSESRRLERLVADLLQLSRLDSRQFTFRPERLELAPLVADAVEAFRPEADAAQVELTVGLASHPWVVVDRDRFAQVVANLVENALKYATRRVHVAVGGGTAAEPTVLVAVTDDGPGIAPADRPHVFERLYVARANPTRKEAGSGLGLAIVRELVTGMGGTVEVRPASPGTQLVVAMPGAPGVT